MPQILVSKITWFERLLLIKLGKKKFYFSSDCRLNPHPKKHKDVSIKKKKKHYKKTKPLFLISTKMTTV